jgi:uncharacterized protein YraI
MVPIKKSLIAICTFVSLGGVACADSAVVSSDLNLRSGPGFDFGVVEVIPGGAAVDARECGRGWCRVNYAGRTGFARSGYLSFGGDARAKAPARRSYEPEPRITNPLLLPGTRPWTW